MKNLTISQTAKLLGFTRQYVWILIKKGKLKAERVGKYYIINSEEVKRYKIDRINKLDL